MLSRPGGSRSAVCSGGRFKRPWVSGPRSHPIAQSSRTNGGGESMFSQQVARAEKLAALGYRAFKLEPMMSPPGDVVELARRFREALVMPTLMVGCRLPVPRRADGPPASVGRLEEFDVYFETSFPVIRSNPTPSSRA